MAVENGHRLGRRKGAPDPTIRSTLPPPTVGKGPGTFPFSITIVIRWLVNILH